MVDVFRALGDPHRLAIVRAALDGECHVQELADRLGISQPAISRHVRQLRTAGLVDVRRRGRHSVITSPPADASPVVVHALGIVVGGRIPSGAPEEPTRRPRANRRNDIEDYLL